MIEQIKKLLGIKSEDFAKLVRDGAQIVDVRSKAEYAMGHIQESINIPMSELMSGMKRMNMHKPAIVCCASGVRSASAKSILKSNGFPEVYNAGGWRNLHDKLRQKGV